MNLLPAMLITTAIIGGTGSLPADLNNADINPANKNCITSQVISGNSSNLESVLNGLGVDLEALKDCFKPSIPDSSQPDTGSPDNGPEAPEPDVPGDDTNTPDLPDTDIPGGDTNTPDTSQPDNSGSDTEQDTNTSYAGQVVDLVNVHRANAGLSPLTMLDDLNNAALIRAKETTQSFSHTRPNGSSFSSVLNENGISYKGAGENIAWGQQTPEAVVNGWMNSDGHRANILNSDYTSIGVGYYSYNSTPYWVQLFTY